VGLIWVKTGAPNTLWFTDDAGTDFQLNTSSSSPWTSASGVIYPDTITDRVSINLAAPPSDETLHVEDDDETSIVYGISSRLTKDSTGTKERWTGVKADLRHTGAGDATLYRGFQSYAEIDNASATIDEWYGYQSVMAVENVSAIYMVTGFHTIAAGINDTIDEYYGFRAAANTSGGSGVITSSYGVYINDQGVNSTFTTGIHIEAQTGTNTYAIFQEGAANASYFAGDLVFLEKSDHSYSPAATLGLLWVKDDAPNTLWFTDDAGTDHALVASTYTSSTTDATKTTISTIATTSGEVQHITATLAGRQTNSANESNTYIIDFRIKNNGGTVTVNTIQATYTSEDVGAWTVGAETSGTDVIITVTGAIGDNISWKCSYKALVM